MFLIDRLKVQNYGGKTRSKLMGTVRREGDKTKITTGGVGGHGLKHPPRGELFRTSVKPASCPQGRYPVQCARKRFKPWPWL